MGGADKGFAYYWLAGLSVFVLFGLLSAAAYVVLQFIWAFWPLSLGVLLLVLLMYPLGRWLDPPAYRELYREVAPGRVGDRRDDSDDE